MGRIKSLWWKLRGIVWRRKNGATTYTLYRSGWVVVSDGISQDAIPINMCSQSFIEGIEKDLAKDAKP